MSSTFETAQKLFRAGRYVELLAGLDTDHLAFSSFSSEHRILVAHTLLQTGEVRRAVELADREIALNPSPGLRSQCEVIKGLASRHNAEVTKALQHYHLAVQYARQEPDNVRLVWASVQR